jgi:hypothetical protein
MLGMVEQTLFDLRDQLTFRSIFVQTNGRPPAAYASNIVLNSLSDYVKRKIGNIMMISIENDHQKLSTILIRFSSRGSFVTIALLVSTDEYYLLLTRKR